MGTIVARRRKSGGSAYMAKIILKSNGEITHRESRTFETHRAAKEWMQRREIELADTGERNAGSTVPTLASLIDRYERDASVEIRKTKAQVHQAIKRDSIARMKADAIRSSDIVDYARRLGMTRSPATVANYISHLSAIFSIAMPAWGVPLSHAAMKDAITVSRRMGLIGSSQKRERRPTVEELDALTAFFEDRHIAAPQATPMHKVIAFALYSTRRQDEITRIRWSDWEGDRVLVRDMKHPGDKIGNNVWCDLPPEAAAVIEAMPRREDRIFPFNRQSLSSNFTRACHMLGIDGLRFHDLRHEGVTRLFEMGWQIPRVAQVSGHRSWQSLQRYTHVREQGDKWAGWVWQRKTPPVKAGLP